MVSRDLVATGVQMAGYADLDQCEIFPPLGVADSPRR